MSNGEEIAVYTCPEGCGALQQTVDALVCSANHRYPIVRGIPRFVAVADNYAEAFGMQWKLFRQTQLDSFTGLPVSTERLDRCVGREGLSAMAAARETCAVLEVGCGAGRFSEVLLAKGVHLTSIDLSDAVDANQANCPQGPTHRIAQADVRNLPFAPGQFDVVLCLGVLQHTPNPEESIAKLVAQVRPGGLLVIDHYRASPWRFLSLKWMWRRLFLTFEREVAMKRVESIVDALLPLHRTLAGVPIARSILGRLSPVHHFYGQLPLSEKLHRDWAILDTHDSLTDYYKHLRTRNQLLETLRSLNLTDIWCEEGGIGVEARARKRSANLPNSA